MPNIYFSHKVRTAMQGAGKFIGRSTRCQLRASARKRMKAGLHLSPAQREAVADYAAAYKPGVVGYFGLKAVEPVFEGPPASQRGWTQGWRFYDMLAAGKVAATIR